MRHALPHLAALLAAALACTHASPSPAAPPPTPPAPVAPADDCDRACQRYVTCYPAMLAQHDATCRQDCHAELTAVGARNYAECLGALPCEAIVASLSMNEGPAGKCYPRDPASRNPPRAVAAPRRP